jgi:selenocysteine lyase/cysteine desulfurase
MPQIVGRFFGADPAQQAVIFTKNTTEAVNKAARIPLSDDDVVIVSLMEHHSNDLPWRAQAKVVHAGVTADGELDAVDLRRKLAAQAGRVKLVAITGASNVTGALNPIHELAELAHRHGALFLADVAQLAPHRAVDMLPADDPGHIDFMVASAHKMYAPYGAGVLIGPKTVFSDGAPDYSGGGTVEIVTEEDVYWTSPPERDEAGSPNVLGAVAMAAACRALTEIGMDRLAQHEAELTRHALTALSGIDGLEIYGDADPARAAGRLGVIPFNVRGLSHYLVAAILSAEYGIGVRNGCFCAHPYVLRLLQIPDDEAWSWRDQVLGGVRAHLPGLVRISFGCYNSLEEVDWLAHALPATPAAKSPGRTSRTRPAARSTSRHSGKISRSTSPSDPRPHFWTSRLADPLWQRGHLGRARDQGGDRRVHRRGLVRRDRYRERETRRQHRAIPPRPDPE